MEITYCPPGYAWGYDNTASVVDGFFAAHGMAVGAKRIHGSAITCLSEVGATKYGAGLSLGDLVDANKGKSK